MRKLTPVMEQNLRAVVRGEQLQRHALDPLIRRKLVTGRKGVYKLTLAGMRVYNRIEET